MSFSVHVMPFGVDVPVEMGQTILDAALAAGIAYPHGCTAGNCGACKSDLLDGDIDLLPYSEFALTPVEAAAGKILACRAVPWSDASVSLLGDDEFVAHAERVVTARIAAIERIAHDVVCVRLEQRSGGPLTFSAGQYATLAFAGQPERDFSMANAPGDPTLEFHLRLIAGGRVSGYVAREAAVGEIVRVRGPFGGAYLRERHAGPVVLAGGGTGLAPMLAIADVLLARDPSRRVELYVAARDTPYLYAHDRLDALAARHPSVRVHRVLSQPTVAHEYRTGFVADAIAADTGDLSGWKAYLAGPPVMVDTTIAVLEARGLARRDIHADAFLPAPAEVPA